MEFLELEEVIHIHERLTADAQNSEDPISPPGIKSLDLLASAVERQRAGSGNYMKYGNPIANAATLCYGICSNHPFHNGNKRTALVSLLCHLDKNGFTFNSRATQNGLYNFMVQIAAHEILPKKKKSRTHDLSDLEIAEMQRWIKNKIRKIEKGERSISFQELEKILKQHGVYFENPEGNYVDLIKEKEIIVRKGFIRKKEEKVTVREKCARIPYFPGRSVGKNLVKSIRQQAGLTHQDGVDSALFYGKETTPDDFIQKYQNTLRKLAKT